MRPKLQQPSPEYQRWERNILSTEEIVLDALCFDMSVEQPWVVLRRALSGFDDLIRSGKNAAESSRNAEEREKLNGQLNGHLNGRSKGKLSERVILDLSWTLMNEAYVHHSSIVSTNSVQPRYTITDPPSPTCLCLRYLRSHHRLCGTDHFARRLCGRFRTRLEFCTGYRVR